MGHEVAALTLRQFEQSHWQGVRILNYKVATSNSKDSHPWIVDFESKLTRGAAIYTYAKAMKAQGYTPDIIYAHSGWGEALFVKDVWPTAKLGNYCEYYYGERGLDLDFDPEFPVPDTEFCRIRIKNINNDMSLDVADLASSPTRWQKHTYPERFASKIRVCHEGVSDLSHLRQQNLSLSLRSGIDLAKEKEVLTFVNRNLEPMRGYHVFLRALPQLLDRRPNLRVVIVGSDQPGYGAPSADGRSWRDVFLDEVTPNLSTAQRSRIHFLGLLDRSHFNTLLALSTVHVYLTYPFILSWSLLEAMSAKCAIVASDVAPVREVIDGKTNGLLVDFFDTQDLSNNIIRLLDDAEFRAHLGEHAHQTVMKHYHAQSVCLPRQLEWMRELLST